MARRGAVCPGRLGQGRVCARAAAAARGDAGRLPARLRLLHQVRLPVRRAHAPVLPAEAARRAEQGHARRRAGRVHAHAGGQPGLPAGDEGVRPLQGGLGAAVRPDLRPGHQRVRVRGQHPRAGRPAVRAPARLQALRCLGVRRQVPAGQGTGPGHPPAARLPHAHGGAHPPRQPADRRGPPRRRPQLPRRRGHLPGRDGPVVEVATTTATTTATTLSMILLLFL
jgi:hypothetical protein